ncbi:cingulin isoform X4 [Anguilla rostrata]|uniref:cingulin isoform X4 n=1 Tax=Anguilla rostrata TaxID=7938 RepID=UPI0030CE891B
MDGTGKTCLVLSPPSCLLQGAGSAPSGASVSPRQTSLSSHLRNRSRPTAESSEHRDCLGSHIAQSQELSSHLSDLQRRTEQEVARIHQQLTEVRHQQDLLNSELRDLETQQAETEALLQGTPSTEDSTALVRVHRELQENVRRRAEQAEALRFQEEGLNALQLMLSEDLQRYQEETQRLQDFSDKMSNGMEAEKERTQENNKESGFDASKQPESPFLETPSTPKPSQNPKYQLFLSSDVMANGSRDTDGPTGENGSRTSRWESNSSRSGTNYRGSLESLASRDWDTMSDRVGGFDSPPRVFNSPYTNSTIDFNPSHRVSEFKDVLSPATSEINLYYSSRSSSPVHTPGAGAPRQRFSAYDTLRRREVAPNVQVMRPGVPNRRDFIEELTKQLDACQKRNQFLEAESVEMEKERNQIRFEMRNLLVNNEDLLRTNAQLQIEMKRTRETMVELQREIQMKTDHLRQLEAEMKEAREVMVEANTQEYAFNYLQQSLQIKIRDSEEALEKQTEHIQMLSEKLWLAERELEQQSIDQEIRDKRTADLTSTVARLELELSEAIQISNQATSEMNLQEKLKHDLVSRVEELEETLLEKNVEAQKLRETVNRLQGEVSGKLFDKERTLEEEIQLRERAQLQCKQAERTLEDLRMEMQTMGQSKDDLVKQLKQAQERMIDLESDLEEMHDNEQRWASKHKRAIEQTEQLQLKLLQMKDLTEQQDCEKAVLERQIRDLRVEVQELQSTRVQEDVITRAENKAKELENSLRTEERNKMVLSNNIGKLERKIGELTEQMEEEHRLANEQKELMAQRIRSLKRQLNEVEEEASRKETQHRHTVRELAEEREANARLQRQLLDQHLKMKRNETLSVRQTLDNLRLDLSDDDEPVTVGQTSTV